MPSLGTTTFKGSSGQPYRFKVFPLGTRFRKISGVYLIANRRRDANGQFRHAVVCVGRPELSKPLVADDKTIDLKQSSTNCICVQSDGSAASRQKKERDLAARFCPEGDDQAAAD